MSTQLHDTGEEFILDYVFTGGATKPTNLTVGLYNDSSDSLSDADDLSAINTEPGGGSYSRQTISFDNTGFSTADSSGDWQVTNDSTLTFNLSDSTSGDVDSYFVVVNFDSDDAGDGGSASDHIFWTGDLSQSYTLSDVDTFDVTTVGGTLT